MEKLALGGGNMGAVGAANDASDRGLSRPVGMRALSRLLAVM
jgi:hypothetical protein